MLSSLGRPLEQLFLSMTILFPADLASIFVLAVLFGTVGFWIWKLGRSWSRIRREEAIIQALRAPEVVKELEEYRREANLQESSPQSFLRQLADQEEIAGDSDVLRHVLSLMEAGIEGARLEVRQRLSSAIDKIFSYNARLKAILSIFIVIGLLGTLYGLAEALATLSANNLLNFEPSVVQTLLGRLETALAPSIWGVFFTIVGVSVYGYYLNAVCQPVKTKLEHATLEEWVPALYPTKSQRAEETLQQARDQLKENVEAAERVATFAERVDEDLEDFDERIRLATNFFGRFSDAVEGLPETTEEFQRAMDGVNTLQTQLKEVFARLDERQQSLNELLERLEERDQKIRDKLGDLESLKKQWRDHLSETQDNLRSVTSSTEDALDRLQDQNEEVVRSLSDPIVTELKDVASKLTELDESMHEGLREVKRSLNNIEDPVSGSAERIERIANTFSDSLHETVSGVKSEFERRNNLNAESSSQIERLNENLEDLISEQREIKNTIDRYDPSYEGVFGRLRRYLGNGK